MRRYVLIGFWFIIGILTLVQNGWTSEFMQGAQSKEEPSFSKEKEEKDNSKILVELFLSKKVKRDLDQIKKELNKVSIRRIRAQFYSLGNAPQNIAIGRNVSAPVARLAFRLAQTYNQGIQFLLPEGLFFPDYIAIGSSAFDEASHVPIAPEDIVRLSDPSLTTEQFHALYRSLTGEDKHPR
jgi:hypothetical protein